MKTILFSLIFFLVFGCQKKTKKETESLDNLSVNSSNETATNKTINKTSEIQKLISRLNPLELPFVYNIWDDDLENIGSESEDSIFIHPYNSIVGYLPDTTDFYGILVMAPADALLPILYTFDKTGQKIDNKGIYLYKCGPDCGLSCEEYAVINKILEINLISKSITSLCEDNPESSDTVKISKTTQQGSISDKGVITYQEPIKKTYIPDSIELNVSGWNSKYFEGATEYFKEKMKLKWINDSTINYKINFEELEMGCETEFWGTAIDKCIDCDPEIDEYGGEAYPVNEYITQNNVDFIYSIRISIDKNKAVIRLKETDEPKDECMPGQKIIMNKYAR